MTHPPLPPRGGAPLRDPAAAAREEVLRARAALAPPGNVHEARRTLKRARALVRLCESGPTAGAAKTIRHGLRDAGRALAAIRDDEASVQAAQEAVEDFHAPAALPARLREVAARSREELDAGAGPRVRNDLRALARKLLELEGALAAEASLRGLARSYARAADAYREARARPRSEALHTLRKRAKDLRHQVEWLTPVWPGVLEAWSRELHALTDDLGRTQDIRLLRLACGGVQDEKLRRRLAGTLRDLRRDSRRARSNAFRRCRRLFAEDPDHFHARVARMAEV